MKTISNAKLRKLEDEDYRYAYLKEMVTGWIVHQIRELREERSWSQAGFGEILKKAQSAVARIEDPSYGRWTVSTLLEIASAFDVALEIKFVDWPAFIASYELTGGRQMQVKSFNKDDFAVSSNVVDVPPKTHAMTPNVFILKDHKKKDLFFDEKKGGLVLERPRNHFTVDDERNMNKSASANSLVITHKG